MGKSIEKIGHQRGEEMAEMKWRWNDIAHRWNDYPECRWNEEHDTVYTDITQR